MVIIMALIMNLESAIDFALFILYLCNNHLMRSKNETYKNKDIIIYI